MKRFFQNNGLTLVLLLFFIVSIALQALTGLLQHNEELASHGRVVLTMSEYLISGHFIEATFENWESEFFQMGLYVLFTAFLYQRGSSESNPLPDENKHPLQKQIDELKEQLKQERIREFGEPWLVRKGGVWKKIYENSFAVVLLALFLISFLLHGYGGWRQNNLEKSLHNEPAQSFIDFLQSADFWFQSFQNWQSEFLSVAVLVILSIFLRQKNSAQSKDVNAPHKMTQD